MGFNNKIKFIDVLMGMVDGSVPERHQGLFDSLGTELDDPSLVIQGVFRGEEYVGDIAYTVSIQGETPLYVFAFRERSADIDDISTGVLESLETNKIRIMHEVMKRERPNSTKVEQSLPYFMAASIVDSGKPGNIAEFDHQERRMDKFIKQGERQISPLGWLGL